MATQASLSPRAALGASRSFDVGGYRLRGRTEQDSNGQEAAGFSPSMRVKKSSFCYLSSYTVRPITGG